MKKNQRKPKDKEFGRAFKKQLRTTYKDIAKFIDNHLDNLGGYRMPVAMEKLVVEQAFVDGMLFAVKFYEGKIGFKERSVKI